MSVVLPTKARVVGHKEDGGTGSAVHGAEQCLLQILDHQETVLGQQ